MQPDLVDLAQRQRRQPVRRQPSGADVGTPQEVSTGAVPCVPVATRGLELMSGAVLTASASWNSAAVGLEPQRQRLRAEVAVDLHQRLESLGLRLHDGREAALSCRKACNSCCRFAPQLSASAVTAAAATHGTTRRNRRRREPPARSRRAASSTRVRRAGSARRRGRTARSGRGCSWYWDSSAARRCPTAPAPDDGGVPARSACRARTRSAAPRALLVSPPFLHAQVLRASRNFWMPSRMRVFTVPSGSPSEPRSPPASARRK